MLINWSDMPLKMAALIDVKTNLKLPKVLNPNQENLPPEAFQRQKMVLRGFGSFLEPSRLIHHCCFSSPCT